MTLFKLIHLLAVLIWVNGIFFAHAVLRPSAAPPPATECGVPPFLQLGMGCSWRDTGHLICLYGGITRVACHVHIMLALGLVMMADTQAGHAESGAGVADCLHCGDRYGAVIGSG